MIVDTYDQYGMPTSVSESPVLIQPTTEVVFYDDNYYRDLLGDGYTNAVPLPPSLGLFVVSLLGTLFFKRMRDN